MYNFSLSSIKTTMEAHRSFNTPIISMILVGRNKSGHLLLPATSNQQPLPHLVTCSILHTHLQSADFLIAIHGLDHMLKAPREFTLISTPDLFDDIYRYVLVSCLEIVEGSTENKWLNIEVAFENLLESTPYFNIVRHLISHGLRDDLNVTDPIQKPPEIKQVRLNRTKVCHETTLCCPLITASGLVFLVDSSGWPIGLILEKRAKTLEREPNKWHLPSGFVEAYESAPQCVARETYEEMNLILEANAVKRQIATFEPSKFEQRWVNWPHIYEVHTKQHPNNFWSGPNNEVDDVRVFPLNGLPDVNDFAFGEGKIIIDLVNVIRSSL